MKCTVISIVPFEINADKIGLHPSVYRVPKSDGVHPEILIIKDASHSVYLGSERTPNNIRVPDSAELVARAIVEDFLISVIGTAPNAHPGIFWKEGAFSKEEVVVQFKSELKQQTQFQYNWFVELKKMADNDWAKSNHKHTAKQSTEPE